MLIGQEEEQSIVEIKRNTKEYDCQRKIVKDSFPPILNALSR